MIPVEIVVLANHAFIILICGHPAHRGANQRKGPSDGCQRSDGNHHL